MEFCSGGDLHTLRQRQPAKHFSEQATRRMFGDDVLGALNIEMVEIARRFGTASKFTGSGGAVIAFCPNGPSQVELLEDACRKAGFSIKPVKIGPSRLTDIDAKTISR